MNARTIIVKIRRWLAEPIMATRGMTISVWAILIGISFGGVYGVNEAIHRVGEVADQRAAERCLLRAESRQSVRAVFLDLYSQVGAVSPDADTQQFLRQARERLDEIYPAISIESCTERDADFMEDV